MKTWKKRRRISIFLVSIHLNIICFVIDTPILTFSITLTFRLKIESIDVVTQVRGQVPIATASRRLYGVAVAPDTCPPAQSVCAYRNGGCGADQLCLPDGNNGRTCADADLTLSRR